MSQPIIRAGDLDQRIDILRPGGDTFDGYQHSPGALAVVKTVWAKVRPAPGQERVVAAQNEATAPSVFTVRFQANLADLDPKCAVRWPKGEAGRLYDIQAVTPLGRRVALEILAIARMDT